MSKKKASIFLESRFYIRQSLSEIFNLNPLKIPIEAHPGVAPKLPQDMGYISISHCNDAFAIAWHHQKIGIDIERNDRKFNYKALAKKYFRVDNISNKVINYDRKFVLKEWCELEAAIKWDNGKLAKDIRNWKYINGANYLTHKTKKIKLKIDHLLFLNWNIALAYKEIRSFCFESIICNNIKNI